jgi:CspA family cold shock protein
MLACVSSDAGTRDNQLPGVSMYDGTVKWFNEAQGYGFIQPSGGGDDVFVDYRAIRGEGFRTLKAGQSVRFKAERSHLGVQATEVAPA